MAVRVPSALVERDPAVLAPEAGLRYLPDSEPGIARHQHRGEFRYVDAFGDAVDPGEVERIETMAVPPAWDHVWISPVADGHLQASGIDDAGRKQYRYHDAFLDLTAARKFDRLQYFARGIVLIRQAAIEGLREPVGCRQHAIAAAIELIDRHLLRVGNDQSASHGHHGATTLTIDHVVDNGYVRLEYTAKSGKERQIVVDDDDLADVLTTLAADADDELFWFEDDGTGERRRATATDINRFVAEVAGPAFSAKDFRTWGGTSTALAARAQGDRLLAAVDEAADVLGNTRAVARSSYIHPLVLETDDEAISDVWSASRSSRWLDRSESALSKLLAAPR